MVPRIPIQRTAPEIKRFRTVYRLPKVELTAHCHALNAWQVHGISQLRYAHFQCRIKILHSQLAYRAEKLAPISVLYSLRQLEDLKALSAIFS